MLQAVANIMAQDGGGAIVNTASMAAHSGPIPCHPRQVAVEGGRNIALLSEACTRQLSDAFKRKTLVQYTQ